MTFLWTSFLGKGGGGAGGGGGNDPNFADVVLLVHFTGSDASTTFTDESNSGHTLTANGNAQIQSNKLELDGTGDYVSATDNDDWTFDGDFTIEVFGVEFDSVAADVALISHYQSQSDDRSWQFIFGEFITPDAMRFAASTNGASNSVFDDEITPATDGTAYNWCIERSGTTLRIYRDGVMESSGTLSGTLHNGSDPLRIGATGNSGAAANFLDGRMSAVRITKGTARYADDGGYTVPSLPLPTS